MMTHQQELNERWERMSPEEREYVPQLVHESQQKARYLQAALEKKRKELKRKEDMLFAAGAMNKPPCFVCRYNGQGYYSPTFHPCAERHHRLWP